MLRGMKVGVKVKQDENERCVWEPRGRPPRRHLNQILFAFFYTGFKPSLLFRVKTLLLCAFARESPSRLNPKNNLLGSF